MDKISRFRRKPKRPTIETSVPRSRSSEPPVATIHVHSPSDPDFLQPGRMSRMSGRISPFKNIRLLSAGKRARSSPPVAQQQIRPSTAVVAKGGHPLRTFASRDGMLEAARMGDDDKSPKAAAVPAFLNLSILDMASKFQELQWTERNRVAEGMRSETPETCRWAPYKHNFTSESGPMDRYSNVWPWQHTRVKLNVEEGIDYVNASSIELPPPTDVSQDPLRFIAMQGPTIPSIEYVWRMIAEQMSTTSAIVQLTTMVENNAIKCHQYFPFEDEHATWELNEDDLWGDGWKAKLTYDSMEELADGAIEKRKLLLHVEGEEEPKIVWHFLYTLWPDFGVPEMDDLDSFFELMELSRQHSDPDGRRIIHCSAGIGRTGTFICLEHLIRELAAGAFDGDPSLLGDDDAVYETVDMLREQRRAMVQGGQQYNFIYDVLRKLWYERHGLKLERGGQTEPPAPKRREVPDPFTDTEDETASRGTATPITEDGGAPLEANGNGTTTS